MLGLFDRPQEVPGTQLPRNVQNMVAPFLDQAFAQLSGANQLTPEAERQKREQLQQSLLAVLQNTQEEIALEGIRRRLLNHEYDNIVLTPNPRRTPELDLLISRDNHFFMGHLFTFCQNSDTLNFWLTTGGATMPQDGIAQAIRLRADVCIFQRLEEDGFFENISMADKTQLTRHASVFLREKPDSLTTFTDMLERHARDFQPQ